MTFCGPVDDFTGASFAAHWPSFYGTTSIDTNRAKISNGSDYAARTSATGYSLDEAEMLVEVDSNGATSGEWYFMFRTDTGSDPGIGRNGTTLWAYGASNTSLGTYSQTTHRWVRIRETGGTIYWDTSPDGSTWTNRHSETATGFTLTSGYIEIGAGNAITFYDNLNSPPSSGTTASPAVVGRGTTVGAPTPSSTAVAAPSVAGRTSTVGSPTVLRSATPTPGAVGAAAVVGSPTVQAGSNVSATPAVVGRTSTVAAPAISASASPTPAAVARSGVVVLPDAVSGGTSATATPTVVRGRSTVGAPGVLADELAWFAGVLKHWNGSAWEPGRLAVRSSDRWSPGQLAVARFATPLQRRMIDDYSKAHEGLLEGVPEFYDWALQPRRGYGNSLGPNNLWTGATAWGEIYPEAGWTPTRNTVCVVRSIGMAVLSTTTGLWTTLDFAEGATELYGAYFQYDFSGNATGPEQLLTVGGNVAGVPGFGFNMHFFPNNRSLISSPGDVGGVVAWFDARLEVAPGASVDDRATSRFLAGAGGDWWVDLSTGYGSGGNNGDWSIGRHRFLTTEWQTFTAHTLTEAQILRNPPAITLAG